MPSAQPTHLSVSSPAGSNSSILRARQANARRTKVITHQAVGRDLGVQLEALLRRGDGIEHRQPVRPRLDVGGRAVLRWAKRVDGFRGMMMRCVIGGHSIGLQTIDPQRTQTDRTRTSSANILLTREIWSRGGMMSEIMLVPLLCARILGVSGTSRRLWYQMTHTMPAMGRPRRQTSSNHAPLGCLEGLDELLHFPRVHRPVSLRILPLLAAAAA